MRRVKLIGATPPTVLDDAGCTLGKTINDSADKEKSRQKAAGEDLEDSEFDLVHLDGGMTIDVGRLTTLLGGCLDGEKTPIMKAWCFQLASSNKCLTTSNKKLVGTSASLLVTSALLVVTRS